MMKYIVYQTVIVAYTMISIFSTERSFDDDGGSNRSKRARFSFTNHMLQVLEGRFAQGRYIAADERKALAEALGIADVQAGFQCLCFSLC